MRTGRSVDELVVLDDVVAAAVDLHGAEATVGARHGVDRAQSNRGIGPEEAKVAEEPRTYRTDRGNIISLWRGRAGVEGVCERGREQGGGAGWDGRVDRGL